MNDKSGILYREICFRDDGLGYSNHLLVLKNEKLTCWWCNKEFKEA